MNRSCANLIAADQSKPQTQEALAEIGTLHEFRWAMFDDDRRMIFASSFDGSWVKYVQDFATSKVGAIIDRNLQHCEDWNGIKDPGASENLLSYAVPAVQYESAYPEPSCRQVVKALGFAEGVPAGAGQPRRRRGAPAPGPEAAAGAGGRLTQPPPWRRRVPARLAATGPGRCARCAMKEPDHVRPFLGPAGPRRTGRRHL